MNIENKGRATQVLSLILTPNAILKLIGAFLIWKIIGLTLGLVFNMGIFILFVVVYFGILWLSPYWQPAYSVLYSIVGNKSISPLLEPRHLRLKWWQYISLGMRLLFLAYLLYASFKLLFQ